MAQITYTNKVALNENPEIADINKVTDDDMNEIKSVVNANYNNTIQITDTEPTDSDNKIWIDTGEIAQQVSEITNSYSTSTGIGYSANYINNNVGVVDSGSNANGNYIKYADGSMICYNTKQYTNIPINNAYGALYESSVITLDNFPVAFIDIPIVSTSINRGTTVWVEALPNLSATGLGTTWFMKPTSSTGSSFWFSYIAIGRWKA